MSDCNPFQPADCRDDPDQLTILAGLPQDETVFEYLTGCWKRLYAANREMSRLGYAADEKAKWAKAFEELKALIISYAGMTLEDPSMFPQPAGYVLWLSALADQKQEGFGTGRVFATPPWCQRWRCVHSW